MGSPWLIVLPLAVGAVAAQELPPLRVSDNRRFLVTADGKPFFWLGDTAWGLPKIPADDLAWYLDRRAAQGFNVVQVHCAWKTPDAAGQKPFVEDDPGQPNELFWQSIDRIVSEAAARGIYVALVPMWGQEYGDAFGGDAAKAGRFGAWIGGRYAARSNVLWVVSGEYDSINHFRLPVSAPQRAVIEAMAQGLHQAHGGRQLMTIHPGASRTSSLDFHGSSWLDFDMLQSGHTIDCQAFRLTENHELIGRDYALTPAKPVLDGEPIYEDTPDGVWVRGRKLDGPRADAAAVRRKGYWAVFAGAFGHTYGHNDIYCFYVPKQPGEIGPPPGQRGNWKDGVEAPGGVEMQFLRSLIESRPMLDRVPDQALLVGEPLPGLDHAVATRAADGSYALLYSPRGKPLTVDLGRLSGERLRVTWYDPRTGQAQAAGEVVRTGQPTFTPPTAGDDQDWVLVLDDLARNYPTP